MERRFARVSADASIIHMIAKGRPDAAITSDWPEDAVLVDGAWDQARGMLWMTIWSSRFDEVPLGNVIPDWNPTFTYRAMEPPTKALIDLIEAFKGDVDAST